jgi:hypothetical protein
MEYRNMRQQFQRIINYRSYSEERVDIEKLFGSCSALNV